MGVVGTVEVLAMDPLLQILFGVLLLDPGLGDGAHVRRLDDELTAGFQRRHDCVDRRENLLAVEMLPYVIADHGVEHGVAEHWEIPMQIGNDVWSYE